MPTDIDVIITADGIKVEPTGHRGAGCLAELNELLAELDKAGVQTDIETQKLKSEYYAAEQRTCRTAKRG